MCETRDLGVKWPFWHTLTFEGDRNIDMTFVCPKDVKKMLLQQARTVYWKKWAAKHEYEELKEGVWLEPPLALLREKTKENSTEKHRHVARKLVLEGGWVQKKLFCPEWYEVRVEIPEPFRKWKKREPQKKVEVAKRYSRAPSQ